MVAQVRLWQQSLGALSYVGQVYDDVDDPAS